MRLQKNELNFEGQNIYVGIHVHLKGWTVTILAKKLHHKAFSQASDVEALVSPKKEESIQRKKLLSTNVFTSLP